jgi:maltooligosyltrehalose trehalohydrolase
MERRVWAPTASNVEIVLGDERRGLLLGLGGWWRGAWEDVAPGTDYAFALDGGKPLPDPRAAHLPHGVHGPARVVDHTAFSWQVDRWAVPDLVDAVIYELHVGTFSPDGTFEGAIERLEHLVGLGVTHVELMPVNSFPGARGWGYDGVGLFAPQESYGGPDGLKRFVDAAHGRGLAVLLDVVYNHLGPDGNYLPRFGPYLTSSHRTPWGDAVNLGDAGSHEVRRFIVDNALMWLRDYRFDGLRIDAVHAFVDLSAVHLLEQLANEVRDLAERLRRPLTLIAESDLNDPRLVRPQAEGGFGLDATWHDEVHHAIHVALTGEKDGYYADFTGVPDLVKAFRSMYVYDGRFSRARQRNHGRPADGVEPSRFVAFAQNHDQVGNRARGERLAALVDADALKVAAALVLAGPFVPLLFQGEEWAASTPFQYFTDHQDVALAQAVRDGRRHEFEAFGWKPEDVPDPQDPATFERSRLRWEELASSPHREMLDWHRRLIALRRALPGLRDGRRPEVHWEKGTSAFVIERTEVSVAVNLGRERARVTLGDDVRAVLLASADWVSVEADGSVNLPPMSVAVVGVPGTRLTPASGLTYGDPT